MNVVTSSGCDEVETSRGIGTLEKKPVLAVCEELNGRKWKDVYTTYAV